MTHDYTLLDDCKCGHASTTHYQETGRGPFLSCLGMGCDCARYCNRYAQAKIPAAAKLPTPVPQVSPVEDDLAVPVHKTGNTTPVISPWYPPPLPPWNPHPYNISVGDRVRVDGFALGRSCIFAEGTVRKVIDKPSGTSYEVQIDGDLFDTEVHGSNLEPA